MSFLLPEGGVIKNNALPHLKEIPKLAFHMRDFPGFGPDLQIKNSQLFIRMLANKTMSRSPLC
jgi:hypothetical protein